MAPSALTGLLTSIQCTSCGETLQVSGVDLSLTETTKDDSNTAVVAAKRRRLSLVGNPTTTSLIDDSPNGSSSSSKDVVSTQTQLSKLSSDSAFPSSCVTQTKDAVSGSFTESSIVGDSLPPSQLSAAAVQHKNQLPFKVDLDGITTTDSGSDKESDKEDAIRRPKRVTVFPDDEDDSDTAACTVWSSMTATETEDYTTQHRDQLQREVEELEARMRELPQCTAIEGDDAESNDLRRLIALANDENIDFTSEQQQLPLLIGKITEVIPETQNGQKNVVVASSQKDMSTPQSATITSISSFSGDVSTTTKESMSSSSGASQVNLTYSSQAFHAPRSLVLTGSGLLPEENRLLMQFCSRFPNARVTKQFEADCTTHVIMHDVKNMPRVVQRTLKFFQGIVARCWLVSVEWVRACVFTATLLPEQDYEVEGDAVCGVAHRGPARARTSDYSLLHGRHICLLGEMVQLSQTDLEALVRLAGGTFYKEPNLLLESMRQKRNDEKFEDTDGSSMPTHLIIADRDDPNFSEEACHRIYQRLKVPIVSRDWLFDSIGKYRLQRLDKEYVVMPTENISF